MARRVMCRGFVRGNEGIIMDSIVGGVEGSDVCRAHLYACTVCARDGRRELCWPPHCGMTSCGGRGSSGT